jgi:hypothetical protein
MKKRLPSGLRLVETYFFHEGGHVPPSYNEFVPLQKENSVDIFLTIEVVVCYWAGYVIPPSPE